MPCRIAHYGCPDRYILRYDGTSANHGAVSDGYPRKDQRTTPYPHVPAYGDRTAELQHLPAQTRITRVVRGKNLNARPNLRPVPNGDFHDIEDHAIEVKEYVIAEMDVVSVIAVKRRPNVHTFPNAAKQLTEQRSTHV